jgi:metal-responsive CopG/Arc/MetJ family transcriptional regulator
LYRKLGASCRSELILSFFRGYVEKQRWRPSRSDTSGGLRALTPPSA